MPITNTTTARVGLDDGNGNGNGDEGNGNSGCGRTTYSYAVILFLMSGIIGYRLLLFQDSVQNKEMSMSISSSISTLASSSNSSSSSSFSSNTTDATSSSNTYPVDHNNDDDDVTATTTTTTTSSMTVKQQQIENYKKGTGLMINVHMTHHGGTTFCGAIGMNGRQGRNYTPYVILKSYPLLSLVSRWMIRPTSKRSLSPMYTSAVSWRHCLFFFLFFPS